MDGLPFVLLVRDGVGSRVKQGTCGLVMELVQCPICCSSSAPFFDTARSERQRVHIKCTFGAGVSIPVDREAASTIPAKKLEWEYQRAGFLGNTAWVLYEGLPAPELIPSRWNHYSEHPTWGAFPDCQSTQAPVSDESPDRDEASRHRTASRTDL